MTRSQPLAAQGATVEALDRRFDLVEGESVTLRDSHGRNYLDAMAAELS